MPLAQRPSLSTAETTRSARHVLLGVRPLRLLHRLRAGVGLGRVEASAAGRGATARGRGGCGQAQRRECGPWARARVGGRGKRSATGTARVSSLAARAADAAGAQAAALPLLAARAARACGACRRRGRASSTPYRRRCRRLSPRRCRPRRPRGPRPPPTPPPTARAPTPPPRPRRRAGRPCRSGRRAAALGERARRAARRGALAGAVAPPVALRRRRARATRAPPKRAAGQLAEVTAVTQLSACCQSARTASRRSRRRVGRATRAIFRPASPSHWDLAKLPLGGADAPTRSPSGSVARSQWEFRKSQWEVPVGKNQVPLGGRNGASGSCKARLEKRVGAARRPSPGPTRTSHWEARHYRARANFWGTFLSPRLRNFREATARTSGCCELRGALPRQCRRGHWSSDAPSSTVRRAAARVGPTLCS